MGNNAPGLGFGDRVPNFARYDSGSSLHVLHNDLHRGQQIVLLALTGADNPEIAAALSALNHKDPLWQDVDRLALFVGNPDTCGQLVARHSLGFPVFADDGSVVQHLIGPPPQPAALAVFVLDHNLRVMDRMNVPGISNTDEILDRIRALYAAQPTIAPQTLSKIAPVLMIPHVFTTEFCDELIATFDDDGGHPSGVLIIEGERAEWQPDPDTKIRRDMEIWEGDLHAHIQTAVARHVLPEIKHCFDYQVTRHEAFKLICYDSSTGGYFRPHRDNSSRDAAHRRFAMSINLNTGDYEGGELVFPEYGPHLYVPERGGAAVFSCSLVHEAHNVTRGKRYALLGFFFDDQSEAEAKALYG